MALKPLNSKATKIKIWLVQKTIHRVQKNTSKMKRLSKRTHCPKRMLSCIWVTFLDSEEKLKSGLPFWAMKNCPKKNIPSKITKVPSTHTHTQNFQCPFLEIISSTCNFSRFKQSDRRNVQTETSLSLTTRVYSVKGHC